MQGRLLTHIPLEQRRSANQHHLRGTTLDEKDAHHLVRERLGPAPQIATHDSNRLSRHLMLPRQEHRRMTAADESGKTNLNHISTFPRDPDTSSRRTRRRPKRTCPSFHLP